MGRKKLTGTKRYPTQKRTEVSLHCVLLHVITDGADVQADLGLCCSYIPKDTFLHDAADIKQELSHDSIAHLLAPYLPMVSH